MKDEAEMVEASAILAYLQNIDDEEDAKEFVRIWIGSVNASLRAIGEKEMDKKIVRKYIAETDRRFGGES